MMLSKPTTKGGSPKAGQKTTKHQATGIEAPTAPPKGSISNVQQMSAEGYNFPVAPTTVQPQHSRSQSSVANVSSKANVGPSSGTLDTPQAVDRFEQVVDRRFRVAMEEAELFRQIKVKSNKLAALENAARPMLAIASRLSTVDRIIEQLEGWLTQMSELRQIRKRGSAPFASPTSFPHPIRGGLEQFWTRARESSTIIEDAQELANTAGGMAIECAKEVQKLMDLRPPLDSVGHNDEVSVNRIIFLEKLIMQISQMLGKYEVIRSMANRWKITLNEEKRKRATGRVS